MGRILLYQFSREILEIYTRRNTKEKKKGGKKKRFGIYFEEGLAHDNNEGLEEKLK